MRQLYQDDQFNQKNLEHENQARELIAYTEKMDKWYAKQNADKQLQEQQTLQTHLLQNKQYDYIGKLIDAVQQQGLGHRQDDKLTTR